MQREGEREVEGLQLTTGSCPDEPTANGKCPVGSTSNAQKLWSIPTEQHNLVDSQLVALKLCCPLADEALCCFPVLWERSGSETKSGLCVCVWGGSQNAQHSSHKMVPQNLCDIHPP